MTKSSATRLLRSLIVGVFATLFFLILAIRFQQYLLRTHAKRLLGQVRSLDLGQATFADAQHIFRQWPSARDANPCVPTQCDFEIGLSDFSAWSNSTGTSIARANSWRTLGKCSDLSFEFASWRIRTSVRHAISTRPNFKGYVGDDHKIPQTLDLLSD